MRTRRSNSKKGATLAMIITVAMITLVAFLGLAGSAAAMGRTPRCHKGYVLRRGYVPHTNKRIWVCVKRTKPRTVTVRVPVPAPAPPAVRATFSLSYTQDPSDPLRVTWTYTASNPDGPLPPSTIRLIVLGHGTISGSGGCTSNVDSATPGSSCTVTVSQAGEYDVTLLYDGGTNSSAAVDSTSYTETDTIQ